MQAKIIRFAVLLPVVAFVGYTSVYFRKLDEVKKSSASTDFDAPAFARDFYHNRLIPHCDSAVHLSSLINLLRKDPNAAFKNYSKAMAVGNIRYFLIRGEGSVISVSDDLVEIQLEGDSTNSKATIATEFIYGNAIRDASGLIGLNDFSSTAIFNTISEEINEIIRREILPGFIAEAEQGKMVQFAGAIEMNQKYPDNAGIEIIPIRLNIYEPKKAVTK